MLCCASFTIVRRKEKTAFLVAQIKKKFLTKSIIYLKYVEIKYIMSHVEIWLNIVNTFEFGHGHVHCHNSLTL